jgi:hypothetical protein
MDFLIACIKHVFKMSYCLTYVPAAEGKSMTPKIEVYLTVVFKKRR